jgi:hypothetical protein
MPPQKKDKGKERARDEDIVEVEKEEQTHNEALSFNGMSTPSTKDVIGPDEGLQRPFSS